MSRRTLYWIIPLLLSACGGSRWVAFEAQRVSPLPMGQDQRVALLPLLQAGEDFDPGWEATRSLRILLEETELFDQITDLEWPQDLLPPEEGPPEEEEEEPVHPVTELLSGESPERLIELAGGADLLILGRLVYQVDRHTGFVERLEHTRYSAVPIRWTERRKVTDQTVSLALAVVDGHTGEIILSRDHKDQERLVQLRESLYDFLEMVQPTMEEFVDTLKGTTIVEKRRLLR